MWGIPSRQMFQRSFARYYNSVPDGVINDRFYQVNLGLLCGLVRLSGNAHAWWIGSSKAFLDGKTPRPLSIRLHHAGVFLEPGADGQEVGDVPRPRLLRSATTATKPPRTCSSVEALVRMFVDIVSKNGNLLLNVGPMADGTIPDLQLAAPGGAGRLADDQRGGDLWHAAMGYRRRRETREGIGVRFTQKAGCPVRHPAGGASPDPRSRSAACSRRDGNRRSGCWETGRPLPGDRRPTASPSPCPRCFRLHRRCR